MTIKMKILLLDNYDSFTYNLLHAVKELGATDVEVVRNDQIELDEVDRFDKIILSPGPGIPEEYQTRIFHKFVQVKGQEAGGSGLGLAICKEIVRAHGGTIWVDSAPGQGSTFTFTLPVVGLENLST